MKTAQILCFTLCLMAILAGPASAATCSGVTMSESLKSGDSELVLNGMGVRLAPFLGFAVYVAGLYLPQRMTDPQAIIGQDQPRRLILQFVEDVNESSMKSGMRRSLAMNAGELTETLKEPMAQFQAAMTGFKKGQIVVFDYLPERGTIVTVDGETATEIEGANFATAWISMWLGRPPNEELKVGLLGGDCF
jgi:hypothetical protein